MKLAEVHTKLESKHDTAGAWVEAAKAFLKSDQTRGWGGGGAACAAATAAAVAAAAAVAEHCCSCWLLARTCGCCNGGGGWWAAKAIILHQRRDTRGRHGAGTGGGGQGVWAAVVAGARVVVGPSGLPSLKSSQPPRQGGGAV